LHESGFVVAGLKSPWVRRRKIRLEELVNERWCLPPRESFPDGWIANAFHASGLEVPRASVTVYSILMSAVDEGLTRRNAHSDVAYRDYCA
jgi:DNA-binding transcriptional LysR family regulator